VYCEFIVVEPLNSEDLFATYAMVEILLGQNLFQDAAKVLRQLERTHGHTPYIQDLKARIKLLSHPPLPVAIEHQGENRVRLTDLDSHMHIEWELTGEGLEMAHRIAKYSGRAIVRLFTAAPGRRGVRTSYQDWDAAPLAAELMLVGLPRPAVFVAAAGFLCNTGEFVPLCRTESIGALLP
jgi:hypothetical protein